MACVTPFELLPETSNTSCFLEQNTSWVNSDSESCVAGMEDARFCQQQFVAMSVPQPLEFPLITGCGDQCNSTMQAVLSATRLDSLSMSAMILQIFGFCIICCMMAIAVSQPESHVVGCCTIFCFIVPILVLHSIGMSEASSISETFTAVREAGCFDTRFTRGADLAAMIDQVIASSDLFWSLGLSVLIFTSFELVGGLLLPCVSDSDESSKFAITIICCQLLASILTWVAYAPERRPPAMVRMHCLMMASIGRPKGGAQA